LRTAIEAIRMIELTPHFDPPLRTRLRFQSQNSNSTRIVEDKALMARTFAWLFGIGGTLALVTLLLPGAPDRSELPFVGVAVEAYPQLQASGGFRDLQAQLATIEDAVQNSRRYYNAVARDLNTAISTIPSNLVAGPMGYHELEFFEATAGERELPKVSF